MFNELKWHSVVMCVISLIAVDDASAGWFGPNTYAECVLDEMKGRPQYMGDTVKDDCRAKFCTFVPPTEEDNVESHKIYKRCLEENGINEESLVQGTFDQTLREFACTGHLAEGHYDCK